MVEKTPKKRMFKKGKQTLGKRSVKIREKKAVEVLNEIAKGKAGVELPKIPQVITDIEKRLHLQSPKINRFISETNHWLAHLQIPGIRYIWLVGIMLSIMFFMSQLWMFRSVSRQLVHLTAQRSALELQLHAWQVVEAQYPLFRDAHVEAALLAYQLGKLDVVESEVKKILAIDPNFTLPQGL